jgi:pyruvate carboxylase
LLKTLQDKHGDKVKEVDAISAALYPKVFDEYRKVIAQYGDLSIIPTRYFLSPPEPTEEFSVELEPGKRLFVKYLACGPLNHHTGKRDVFFELNGSPRVVAVHDKHAATEHVERERADPTAGPGEVGAPMSGVVVELRVHEGAHVKDGDPICVLSAMKMETIVASPVTGVVSRIAVKMNDSLSAGDLICRIGKK